MKFSRFPLLIAFVAIALSVGNSFAATVSKQSIAIPVEQIEHGGGCRKSSPPGKCCHAGSKPLHCH